MQRLGIRKKALIALLGVAVPALITFSALVITTTAHILQSRATDQVTQLAARSAAGLGTLVARSQTTLRTISGSPEITGFIKAVESNNPNQIQTSVKQTEKAFYGWQRLDPTIQAIRLIDPAGNVIVKIKEGKVIVPRGNINKPYGLRSVHSVANRDFFKAAKQLKHNEVLISNLERGKVEEDDDEFCPAMVRFATPVLKGDGSTAAILIINVWGEQAGQLINRLISDQEGSAFLVERNTADRKRNGIYLFHRDTSCEFGDQTGSQRTVFTDYPDEITEKWMKTPSGSTIDPRSRDILAHAYYSPYENKERGWVVVVNAKRDYFMEPIASIGRLTVYWAILVVALAVAFSIYFARSLTRPLQTVVDGVHRMSIHPGERLSAAATDEVGFLAGEINRMADAIQTNAEEKVKVEEQIRNTEKLAAVGEMAAGLAHELNTPLGNIKALALLARKDLTTSPENIGSLDKDLGDIADQAVKCSGIISGLLSFSRQTEASPVICSPSGVVDDAISLVRLKAEKSGVTINKLPLPTDCELYVDYNQLRQVFVNILLNAIDAAPGGQISINCRKMPGEFLFVFEDNGCGIPPELIDRIFDPFFTTKEVGQGTGLGLSVSYGIVSGMGGRMIVSSEPGRGTSFTVVLPAEEKVTKCQE